MPIIDALWVATSVLFPGANFHNLHDTSSKESNLEQPKKYPSLPDHPTPPPEPSVVALVATQAKYLDIPISRMPGWHNRTPHGVRRTRGHALFPQIEETCGVGPRCEGCLKGCPFNGNIHVLILLLSFRVKILLEVVQVRT